MARDYILYRPFSERANYLSGLEYQQSVQPKPETKKNIMDIKPIKFPLLAELASGSPILCIQGKITDLFKPNTGTHAQYGDWIIQNGTISDDTSA